MAVTQGSFGQCRVWDDFLGPDNDLTWGTGTVKVGNFGFVSVNEGTFEWTIDEGNGVLAITTDTGDDDNAALFAGTFIPSVNGPLICEARFKFNSATLGSVFCGFTQTLALDTPVMPMEFATATMTYNGTGQILGENYDVDGTTDDFRASAGTAGAVTGTNYATNAALAATGIRANETLTADEWHITRVELSGDGIGTIWHGHKGRQLDQIVRITGLGTTNALNAMCMIENRTANARILEVDYGYASGSRDWEVT